MLPQGDRVVEMDAEGDRAGIISCNGIETGLCSSGSRAVQGVGTHY